MKELFPFEERYDQLPEESLPKWVVRGTHRGCVFGFECRRVDEHFGVGKGPAAHYGIITDSSMGSRHTGGHSRGNSQPGGLDTSHCHVC